MSSTICPGHCPKTCAQWALQYGGVDANRSDVRKGGRKADIADPIIERPWQGFRLLYDAE